MRDHTDQVFSRRDVFRRKLLEVSLKKKANTTRRTAQNVTQSKERRSQSSGLSAIAESVKIKSKVKDQLESKRKHSMSDEPRQRKRRNPGGLPAFAVSQCAARAINVSADLARPRRHLCLRVGSYAKIR